MWNRKGYSLAMWTVILGVGLGAVMIYQISAKRALQGKAMRGADYLFWRMWQEEPQQYLEHGRGESETILQQYVVTTSGEDGGVVSLDFSVNNNDNRYYKSND